MSNEDTIWIGFRVKGRLKQRLEKAMQTLSRTGAVIGNEGLLRVLDEFDDTGDIAITPAAKRRRKPAAAK